MHRGGLGGELQNKYLYLNPNLHPCPNLLHHYSHMTRERNRAGNHKDLGKSLGDRMRTRYESGTRRDQRFCLNLHSSEFKLGSNTGWSEIFILTSLLVVTESQCSLRTLQLWLGLPGAFSKAGNTIFCFTVGGFRFGYENQVQLDSEEFSSLQLIPYWASFP